MSAHPLDSALADLWAKSNAAHRTAHDAGLRQHAARRAAGTHDWQRDVWGTARALTAADPVVALAAAVSGAYCRIHKLPVAAWQTAQAVAENHQLARLLD